MSRTEPIVLAIESALGGGSVSLCRGTKELSSWIGEEGRTRAEDLLPNIIRMLEDNSLALRELDAVAVATGPGSFTGIRIGIATVLGLRAGSGVRCVGMTSLAAMSCLAQSSSTVIVPVGGKYFCTQRFGDPSNEGPSLVEYSAVAEALQTDGVSTVISHGSIAEQVRAAVEEGVTVIDAGLNIARLVALAAFGEFASEDLSPLFLDRNKFVTAQQA